MTPKRILGTIFSLVITAFMLTGLVVIVGLSQKSQDIKRSKAAGETIKLDILPAVITANQNQEFNVVIQAAPVDTSNPNKVTAVSVGLNFSGLTLVSVMPAVGTTALFDYPAGTEALSLGTTCSTVADCRTTATGISCLNNRCVKTDGTYPANTSGSVHFDVGAACSTVSPWVCYPAAVDHGGVVATLKFRAVDQGLAFISFNNSTAVAALDSTSGQPANNNTNVGILGIAKAITINPPDAASAVLPFKLTFEGISAANSINCPSRTVRVILKQGSNQISKTNVVTTADVSGVYNGSLTGIVPGTYDVYLKGPAHLTSLYPGVVINSSTPTQDWSAIPQKAGDIAGSVNGNGPDNLIETSDLGRLINDFAIGVQKVSVADLDCNGKVDTTDLGILIDNFKIGVPGPGGRE